MTLAPRKMTSQLNFLHRDFDEMILGKPCADVLPKKPVERAPSPWTGGEELPPGFGPGSSAKSASRFCILVPLVNASVVYIPIDWWATNGTLEKPERMATDGIGCFVDFGCGTFPRARYGSIGGYADCLACGIMQCNGNVLN